MNHGDHVRLLREGVWPRGVPEGEGRALVWADIGAGSGAFTLALADLLGAGATIHVVDRDESALHALARSVRASFPAVSLAVQVADFTTRLALPPLDGIVMANALHFARDPVPVVARLRAHLKPSGSFILVEYDTDRGNRWVPYPLSYRSWQTLAPACGFRATRLLASRPSRFLGAIYAALSE